MLSIKMENAEGGVSQVLAFFTSKNLAIIRYVEFHFVATLLINLNSGILFFSWYVFRSKFIATLLLLKYETISFTKSMSIHPKPFCI